MIRTYRLFLFSILIAVFAPAQPLKVLIVDGQNNHQWKETTPVLKEILLKTGLFEVDVATGPPKGSDMSTFRPDFSAYSVVLSNYTGDAWPAETKGAFERFVKEGGGFVAYHAADNAFPDWPAYNEMIGLGGWEGRTEKAGPRVFWEEGKLVFDTSAGKAGHHGKRHPFAVVMRNREHPIAKGLPAEWKHASDELYDNLRGPAKNMDVLATAYSDPGPGGTGKHELILFTLRYGKGRIFHTVLGHDTEAMRSTGFAATLARGTEWAGSGKVTQKAPAAW